MALLPSGDRENLEVLSITLKVINDHVADLGFTEEGDYGKEHTTCLMLRNALERCAACIPSIDDVFFPQKPVYVTKEEAETKLVEEYMKDCENGDDTVLSQSIDDWMADHRYILVKDEDERKKRMMEDEASSGDSVNSRKEF